MVIAGMTTAPRDWASSAVASGFSAFLSETSLWSEDRSMRGQPPSIRSWATRSSEASGLDSSAWLVLTEAPRARAVVPPRVASRGKEYDRIVPGRSGCGLRSGI